MQHAALGEGDHTPLERSGFDVLADQLLIASGDFAGNKLGAFFNGSG